MQDSLSELLEPVGDDDQAVGQESFSFGVALAGFLIWFGFTAVSYILAGGNQ